MKLRTATSSVETSGLTESTAFSIKVNGKAFKILLDGLYSDKVGAVVRELCTNAYDAHLAIGKGDTPFVVRLPTLFDPTFRVRDFGVSMTHEQVFRLMTTVFESSKDTSNTQVGAFGLGSKSPFSLVDTFSLTVWKDGEKRVYSAFINTDGVPSLALLGKEASSEPQGVQIEMTVDQKDVHPFTGKAQSILRWFPTFPKIEGNAITLAQPTVIAQGKGWYLLGGNDTHGGARARQGCVVYPLSASSISNISEEHRALLAAPILIDFPIGSLDVAASREGLSYDAATSQNILARLNSVADELKDHYGKAIKDAPTLWEAGKKLRELSHASLPYTLVQLLCHTKWKGTIRCDQFHMPKILTDLDAKGVKISPYFWHHYRMGRLQASVYIDGQSLNDGKRVVWSYGDEGLSIYFAVEGERTTHEGRRIIEDFKKTLGRGAVLRVLLAKEDDHKDVLDALGNPPSTMIRWVRDLPEAVLPQRGPAPKRGTTKKEEVKAREVTYDSVTGLFGMQPEKVVPLDGEAHYILVRNYVVQDTSNTNVVEFLRNLSEVNKVGYVPRKLPIYVVGVTYNKRLENHQDWKPLVGVVRDALKGDFEEKWFAEAERKALNQTMASCNWCTILRNDARFGATLDRMKFGPLYELHKTIQTHSLDNTFNASNQAPYEFAKASYALGSFGLDSRDMYDRIGARVVKSTKLIALHAAITACNAAYPLIRNYDAYKLNRGSSSDLAMVFEYIEAIDTLRAVRAAKNTALAA
jgi:hypothetical protein